jgi:hypothetical protein
VAKLIVILLLTVGLGASQAPQTGDKHEQANNGRPNEASKGQETRNGVPTIIQKPAVNSGPSEQEGQRQANAPADPPHDWIDKLNAFSTCVIAAFTILLFFGVMRQISTSRDIERAWVLVTSIGNPIPLSRPIPPGYVVGIVYNFQIFGTTPARITAVRFRCHLVEAHKSSIPSAPKLPPEPKYSTGRQPSEIPEGGRTVAPGGPFSIGVNIESSMSSAELADLRDKKKFLCSYGFIEYKDAFGRSGKTQLCYVYNWPVGGVITAPGGQVLNGEGFQLGGPPAYNTES